MSEHTNRQPSARVVEGMPSEVIIMYKDDDGATKYRSGTREEALALQRAAECCNREGGNTTMQDNDGKDILDFETAVKLNAGKPLTPWEEAKADLGLSAERPRADFTRATSLTPEVEAAIDDAFEYHPWDDSQVWRGRDVREALSQAVKVIVANVPPSADRSAAIRKLREARMDCNSAITHNGKY